MTFSQTFFPPVNLDIIKSKGFVYAVWAMSNISYSIVKDYCILKNKNDLLYIT